VAFKNPKQVTRAGTETGVTKAQLSRDKDLLGGFLAGAYIAFGGLLAITVSSGLKPETWGSLPTLFTGAVFSLGLILVVVAGSELVTGNMALVPLAFMQRRIGIRRTLENLGWVTIGNLAGALFVAYFLAVKTGVVTANLQFHRLSEIATAKGVTESDLQIFLRALGCNWLVCLAVWMSLAAEDIAGKVLAIFFPIMGFVAMGFDHVVANFFFLPAAIFAHVPGISWGDALRNWAFAFLGNLVGATVFVAASYWYLYARGPDAAPAVGGISSAEGAPSEEAARAAASSLQPSA
jgi:formate/nitrite transporter